jgi:lipopolysaccharide export system protein LptA
MSAKLHRQVLASLGALALAFVCAKSLPAQTLTNTFGGLSESSDEPIDIESDLLVVHDRDKYAVFTGNVKAVQGTTTLRAKELQVHYVGGDKLAPGAKKDEAETKVADAQGAGGDAAAASGNAGAGEEKKGETQITKIEAKGDVIIESEDDQTTTSDWALYDLPSQLVTVGGNVVLTQGKNVLKGNRLVIDLKTGESRFENTGNTAAGGRIRALFMPKQDGAGDAKEGDAKAGDAKAGEAKSGEAKSGGATAKHEAPSERKPDTTDQSDKAKDNDWTSSDDPFIPEMRP